LLVLRPTTPMAIKLLLRQEIVTFSYAPLFYSFV
jgi:hypothetical protein